MEIIDELELVTRGPYTGSIGYLGFNRESQFNIAIRTAIVRQEHVWFQVGAGIVADSDPEMEHSETLAKAAGFEAALTLAPYPLPPAVQCYSCTVCTPYPDFLRARMPFTAALALLRVVMMGVPV